MDSSGSKVVGRARFLAILILALSLGFPMAGHTQLAPGYPERLQAYDPREVAMLPKYCLYTQDFRNTIPGGDNPAEIQRWYATLGPPFHSMHHYCWGLMKTNRANFLVRDRQSRLAYLRDAIGEFDYILERSPQDFVLRPEILTRKGENLIRLGQTALGIAAFEEASQLKPDYWAPYAQLSDHYRDTGDLKNAREILKTGIERAADAKPLQRRLAELDAETGKRTAEQRQAQESKTPAPR